METAQRHQFVCSFRRWRWRDVRLKRLADARLLRQTQCGTQRFKMAFGLHSIVLSLNGPKITKSYKNAKAKILAPDYK